MTRDYHYDMAWERILDLQREAENRRLQANAYSWATSAPLRRMAAWTGAKFVRAGSALSRWADSTAGGEGRPEVA